MGQDAVYYSGCFPSLSQVDRVVLVCRTCDINLKRMIISKDWQLDYI